MFIHVPKIKIAMKGYWFDTMEKILHTAAAQAQRAWLGLQWSDPKIAVVLKSRGTWEVGPKRDIDQI